MSVFVVMLRVGVQHENVGAFFPGAARKCEGLTHIFIPSCLLVPPLAPLPDYIVLPWGGGAETPPTLSFLEPGYQSSLKSMIAHPSHNS